MYTHIYQRKDDFYLAAIASCHRVIASAKKKRAEKIIKYYYIIY